MADNVGGGPEGGKLNGRVIDPIELERRLSQIEGGIERLEQKIDQWTKSHEAWGISQNMQTLGRLDALQEAISELKTANAVCSNRWDNHEKEHTGHEKEHEALTRKERTVDVIVGVVSSTIGLVASAFNQ